MKTNGTPYAKAVCFICLAFVLALWGCGIPTRIFQTKVPEKIEKTAGQVEGERQAADLIAKGIQKPDSLKPVAAGLSNSLGKPEKPLPSDTPEQVDNSALLAIGRLENGILRMQKQIDAQNKFIAKYAGKELEGTGVSLLGPGMGALAIGLVVLAIACPPVMTLMFFAFRRLKAAAGIVVNEMEKAKSDPAAKDAVAKIKENIAGAMTEHPQRTDLLKGVITKLKQ